MQNQTINDKALAMTLQDLGLTPQTGAALCVLIKENNENLLRIASTRKCTGKPGECGSCGKRPDGCKKALHQLPEIYAWRVLKKWTKYCEEHMPHSKREECPVRQFLIPAMKSLLTALMREGLSLEYVRVEVPCAERILAFGSPGALVVVG